MYRSKEYASHGHFDDLNKDKLQTENVKDKSLVNHLLKKIEQFVCLHIEEQVKAGADVIQIFDSWAGLIPEKDLDMYCFKPNFTVANYTKSLKVPVICFPRGIGQHYSNFCKLVKPHCISIDYTVKPEWAKKNLRDVTIQGGLDPKTLLETREVLEKEVRRYNKDQINNNRAYGELGHPEGPTINLERASHMITKLYPDGKNFIGEAKVLSTPMGKIVENLLDDGAKLGV